MSLAQVIPMPKPTSWRDRVRMPAGMRKRLDKINAKLVTKRTVRFATAVVTVESSLGAFTTAATASAFIAMGHPLLALGAVCLYLVSVTTRYILANAALIHESESGR